MNDNQTLEHEIIKDIQKVASSLGQDCLSLTEYKSKGGQYSDYQIHKFKWNDLVKKAGLIPHTETKLISEDDLWSEMERVFLVGGKVHTCTEFKRHHEKKYKFDTYKKRAKRLRGTGSWTAILWSFRKWLEENDKQFPFMAQLPSIEDSSVSGRKHEIHGKNIAWDSTGGEKLGGVLDFRGLIYEPKEEVEVVFLFGAICEELGFRIVEIRDNKTPDCIAHRRIKGKGDKWEKVEIEFKLRSSLYNYSQDTCDILICWIHDKKDCSVKEVIELKSEIENRNLPKRVFDVSRRGRP